MPTLAIAALFGLAVVFIYDAATRPVRPGDLAARWSRRAPSVVCGIALGAGAYALSAWPVAGIGGVIAGAMTPGMIASSRRQRLALARREAIADVAARLRDSVRAGIGLSDALGQAAKAAPACISRELTQLVSTARIAGLPKAAATFAEEVPDPCARMLAAALGFADTLGSRSLSDVLDALAESAAAEASTVREAHARQANARTSARVISVVPGLLLLAIRHENPAYVAPLGTHAGQVVLGIAGMLVGSGYVLMRRLGDLEAGAA